MMSSVCFGLRKVLPENFKHELLAIFKLAWPLVVCNLAEFAIPVITLQFIGQLGETPLAAVGLGLSFCNIFGYSITIGLDTATATLCSQSYGAKNYRRFGIVIQRAVIIQLFVTCCMIGVWIHSENILLLLQQDKDASRLADTFIIWRIPSFILQGVYKTLRSYLICQHIVLPLVIVSIISVGFCAACNYILVNVVQLGVIGSGIAFNLSYLVFVVIVLVYIHVRKVYKMWPGWSWECLLEWRQFFSLALPGALMIIFDWTTAELGVFLLGLVGKKELGAQSVILNIGGLIFMIPHGISIAATVSVGKFLGSGEPRKAVDTAKSALISTWSIGICLAALFLGIKNYVGHTFTSSKEVADIITKVMPLVCGFLLLDGTQGVSCGILRGLGLQKYGATVNFIGLDIIGLPLGAVFAIVLRWGVMGFWIGIATGMLCQVIALLTTMVVISWEKQSKKARSRAGVEETTPTNDLILQVLADDKEEPEDDTKAADIEKNEIESRNGDGPKEIHHETIVKEEENNLLRGTILSDAQTISNVTKLTHIILIVFIPCIILGVTLSLRMFL